MHAAILMRVLPGDAFFVDPATVAQQRPSALQDGTAPGVGGFGFMNGGVIDLL